MAGFISQALNYDIFKTSKPKQKKLILDLV